MFGEEEIIKTHRERAAMIANLILIAFGLIVARLWYLQIYKGNLLYQYSLQNRLRREIVRAPRGKIFSRDNQVLVDNTPRFDAILTPQYLSKRELTIEKLSKILDMPVASIKKTILKNSTMASYRPIIIKKNISRQEVAMIETENNELPGISVDTFVSREYTDKTIGAHLLGYISEISQTQLPKYTKRDGINYGLGDFIGQFGLEEQLDQTIRGSNGYEFVEVDAFGRKRRDMNDQFFKGIKSRPSIPGNNVRLTIDRDLQIVANNTLGDKVGSAVAIEINTGEVLAMVSHPSFDPSQFSRELTSDYWSSLVTNENNPLRDRTIQEHYSPGSTFKLVTGITALEEGAIDPNSEIVCSGSLKFGRRAYHCWKKEGHGRVALTRAIRESCNIFFQRAAMKLDIDSISKYAHMLGLGQKSGIELPREIPGLIPNTTWKKTKLGVEWQPGETLSCAIGQSYVLATPLQLAMAYATVGNNGTLYRPYIVKEIVATDGTILKQNGPQITSKLNVKPTTLESMRRGFYEVVNHPSGTAFSHRGKGIQMAGKTGTSQVIRASADSVYSKCESQEYKYRHHGLFVAFAPYQSPKIAVAVLVEHGCHGGSAAAPVAEAVITTYLKKYWPALYEENLKYEKTHPSVGRVIEAGDE